MKSATFSKPLLLHLEFEKPSAEVLTRSIAHQKVQNGENCALQRLPSPFYVTRSFSWTVYQNTSLDSMGPLCGSMRWRRSSVDVTGSADVYWTGPLYPKRLCCSSITVFFGLNEIEFLFAGSEREGWGDVKKRRREESILKMRPWLPSGINNSWRKVADELDILRKENFHLEESDRFYGRCAYFWKETFGGGFWHECQ